MIKIFRDIYRTINIEFNKKEACDILKMFNELYKGREYKLMVEFDMSLIQKKKEKKNITLICKYSNEEDSSFKRQNERIFWLINQDDIEVGMERFIKCKNEEKFFPSEFILMRIPRCEKLNYVYCMLIH